MRMMSPFLQISFFCTKSYTVQKLGNTLFYSVTVTNANNYKSTKLNPDPKPIESNITQNLNI